MRFNDNSTYEFVPFKGGLDTETPAIEVPMGFLRESENVEVSVQGGYTTPKGYERYDGRASPSSAIYAILGVTITGSIEVGDTITGVTSTETARVIAVADDESYLVITAASGEFDSGEVLNVSASPEATTTSVSINSAAATQELDREYNALAAAYYRTLISAVPGSGSVLGVWMIGNDVYAVRNNVGATAAVIHKATGSGWTAVDTGRELDFTSGSTEIEAGDTITGATSAATATVGKVVVTSGTWGAGDAAGYLVLTAQTGTFTAENLDVGASLNVATIAGNSAAVTLAIGGRYETVYKNFAGSGSRKIYGCSGANKGFEFDGTVYAQIRTGMADDRPNHVHVHKFQLFFSFGPSVQHSAPGEPFNWSPVVGAGEIAVGDNVTAFSSEYGSEAGAALAIYSRNSINILYGNDDSDWQLVPYRDEIGAYPYTVQQLGQTIRVDDQGITSLGQSQDFGNFANASLSARINSWIFTRKSTAISSTFCRAKSQYRLYFSDNSALYITFEGRKVLGMMPQMLDHQITCVISQEDTSGNERIYAGTESGYVMEMEKGTSFDGAAIDWYFMTHFAHFGSPRLQKRYFSASIETVGLGYCAFQFSFELGYGSTALHQPTADLSIEAEFNASRWDEFTWDQFWWDGQSISPSYAKLFGDAENISFVLRGSSAEYNPILFSGINTRLRAGRYLK